MGWAMPRTGASSTHGRCALYVVYALVVLIFGSIVNLNFFRINSYGLQVGAPAHSCTIPARVDRGLCWTDRFEFEMTCVSRKVVKFVQ